MGAVVRIVRSEMLRQTETLPACSGENVSEHLLNCPPLYPRHRGITPG